MKFSDYQKLFHKTAIYPNRGDNLAYAVLGLNGEAGEVAEKLKKEMRDGHQTDVEDSAMAMLKELGDVLWYVTACAYENGFTLEDVARMNTKKLESRLERNKLGGSGDER